MMTRMRWAGQKILLAGAGRTGMSVLGYLQHQGAHVWLYDDNITRKTQASAEQLGARLCCAGSVNSLKTALASNTFDTLILSPGFSAFAPEVVAFEKQGGRVLGDIAILAEELRDSGSKIIAITGSNGKTTTTALTGFLCATLGLQTVVAGNIGTPVLDALRNLQGKAADVWVLELSSFQLETAGNFQADAATVLNISDDHLERYESLLHYAHVKSRVFAGSPKQVLNADDALCRAMKRADLQVAMFSVKETSDYFYRENGDLQVALKGQPSVTLTSKNALPLTGRHNMANVLAAVALCAAIGLPQEKLARAAEMFLPLEHRMQFVAEIGGVTYLNDSKGTNVGATLAALEGLETPVVLLAGGVGKGQDFSPLQLVLKKKARVVVLFGQDAELIRQALAGSHFPVVMVETLAEAVSVARTVAKAGDTVLLSPAAASLDMFEGYAARGEAFMQLIKGLA